MNNNMSCIVISVSFQTIYSINYASTQPITKPQYKEWTVGPPKSEVLLHAYRIIHVITIITVS